jgi:hypothetical protein
VRESRAQVHAVTNLVRTFVRFRLAWRAAAVALLVVAAAAAWSLISSPEPAAPAGIVEKKTFDPGMEQFSSLTPDGQWIAFRSGRDGGRIWKMRSMGEGLSRVTPAGVTAAYNPTWSHDGAEIAYTTEDVQLTPLNGEGLNLLRVVNVDTGVQRQLEVSDAVQANWSPGGDRIAYVARQWGTSAEGEAAPVGMDSWTIPATGGDPVAVTGGTSHDWSPIWSPEGRYLYFVSDRAGSMSLWRVAIDEKSGRRRGDPRPVTGPSAPFLAHPSFSADGRMIAYSAVSKATNIRRLELDDREGGPDPGDLGVARVGQSGPDLGRRVGRVLLAGRGRCVRLSSRPNWAEVPDERRIQRSSAPLVTRQDACRLLHGWPWAGSESVDGRDRWRQPSARRRAVRSGLVPGRLPPGVVPR